MAELIKNAGAVHEQRPVALGALIHQYVREAIEIAVHEELAAALGAARYERNDARLGYRNGTKARTLTGPTGPLDLTLPRGLVHTSAGRQEWTSTIVPRWTVSNMNAIRRRSPRRRASVIAT
jgi:transposase-like protein